MKIRAIALGATIVLTSCGASQEHRAADAISSPVSGAPTAAATGLVTPQSGASEAAKAAGAESRKVIIPKIRDVPASGATSPSPNAALVTPQSGASEAAKAAQATPRISATQSGLITPQNGASETPKAAGAESRDVNIPTPRGVPASGVTSAPSAASAKYADGSLPPGVPYASNTDPVRIISFEISSTVFHPGDDITGDVITTSNAASVTAQVGTMRVTVPRVAPGKFHLNLELPDIPLPPGPAELIIRAIRTDGKTVTRSVTITVER